MSAPLGQEGLAPEIDALRSEWPPQLDRGLAVVRALDKTMPRTAGWETPWA